MFNRKGLLIFLSLSISLNAWAVTDPTRPAGYSGPGPAGMSMGNQAEKFELTSILYSDSRRIAVIDGVARKKGDVFNGNTVLEIKDSGVVLKTDKGVLKLDLNPYEVKGQRHNDRVGS